MTQRETLTCVHEPFGDAYYYGPERLSSRFNDDRAKREASGFSSISYKDVMDQIEAHIQEDKRVFIKDIAYYLFPENGAPAKLAPSLADVHAKGSAKPRTHLNGNSELDRTETLGDNKDTKTKQNPTVIPEYYLRQFHFTFLIRHPRRAIPSFFRCTVPPLNEKTGFHEFMPSEAGYAELRRLFDYVKSHGLTGATEASQSTNSEAHVGMTVVDADDLLDHPAEIIEAYCRQVGIKYTSDMLLWDDDEHHEHASKQFEKWNGFHDDAIGSTSLKPRSHGVKNVTVEEENEQWRSNFGEEAQKVIRDCVDANVPHYEYLKSFAIKI